MNSSFIKIAGLIAVLVLALQGSALAHVVLDHADPKVGSENAKAPTEVKIYFSDDIEPSLSSMEVLDASGQQVDKKDCKVDAKDKTLLVVSLPALPAGTYKVVWHVVCTQTHKIKGDFRFVVK
jgi:methionine-rich copper-binding protein CopC